MSDLLDIEVKVISYREKYSKILTNFQGSRVEFYSLIIDFAMSLKDRYKNCRNYVMFHILLGDELPEDIDLGKFEFDFPGEDSIADKIDKLHQEYIIKI